MSDLKTLPHYGIISNSQKFFWPMKKGDLFSYSPVFSFSEVKKRAERRGIIIKKTSKDGLVEVVENTLKQKRVFHFNEELIDA